MKKIELKFAAQKMTKEQMKMVTGGKKDCTATIVCYNISSDEIAELDNVITNCDVDQHSTCAAGLGDLDWYAASCTCN